MGRPGTCGTRSAHRARSPTALEPISARCVRERRTGKLAVRVPRDDPCIRSLSQSTGARDRSLNTHTGHPRRRRRRRRRRQETPWSGDFMLPIEDRCERRSWLPHHPRPISDTQIRPAARKASTFGASRMAITKARSGRSERLIGTRQLHLLLGGAQHFTITRAELLRACRA